MRVEVIETMPSFEPTLEVPADANVLPTVEEVVRGAVRLRVRASQARAERAMRGMGVRPRAVEARRRAGGA